MRGAQPTSSALGLHLASPKKTHSFIHIPGFDAKKNRLLNQMAVLMKTSIIDDFLLWQRLVWTLPTSPSTQIMANCILHA
jgi:hypothetical protein